MKQNKNSEQIIAGFLQSRRQRVESLLDMYLSAVCESKNLCTAMRYAVLNAGKRLRPLLVYATGEAYGARLKVLDVSACAVEIIHSFSLVHDDLPAIDNDDLRRGKLACHKAFDEATAILAGDALSVFAFQIINESIVLTSQQKVSMSKILASASGPNGMACGQDIDIQSIGKKLSTSKLEYMYLLKTGALICAAVRLGASAANVSDQAELRCLDQFAKNAGLAFQIQDDILNIESSAIRLGKNIGTDSAHNRITYPALVGVSVAKEKVKKLYQLAEKNLQRLKADASVLRAVVDQIRQRDH